MPGSLLYSPPSPRSRVTRHESTRSDHSDGSNTSQSSTAGKKVSFNKAVRVKKYSRSKKSGSSVLPNGSVASNGGSPEKRFWFKVYKNKHRQSPDPKELSHGNTNGVIYYNNDFKYVDNVITRHESDDNPQDFIECGCVTPPPPEYSGLELHPLEPAINHLPLHSSQMPTELPHVKRNHVKKIVTKFNEEAVLSRQRSLEENVDRSPSPSCYICRSSTPTKMQRIPTPPPSSPRFYSGKHSMSSKLKKNPIVNGVKVIFGMGQVKKKDKSPTMFDSTLRTNREVEHCNLCDDNSDGENERIYKPYKTEIEVSNGKERGRERKTARDHRLSYAKDIRLADENNRLVSKSRGGLFAHDEEGNATDDYDNYFTNENNDNYNQRHGKCHVETWDSGNQLVLDTTDVNTSSTRLDNGEMFCTVGEKHQVWKNNKKMIIVEEPSPIITRRKAKSHSDLTNSQKSPTQNSNMDKGISTEHVSTDKYLENDNRLKDDSWMKLWTTSMKDKGVQCNQVPTSDNSKPEEIYAFGKYKIVKPRNGVATAYSNVPSLEKVNLKTTNGSISKDDYNNSAVSSSYRSGDIYSIIDKTKKKKDQEKKKAESFKSGNIFKSRSEPLYIGPPPKSVQNSSDDQEITFYDDHGDRTIKTSSRSFGFHLSPGREEIGRKAKKSELSSYKEENWYDIEDDVKAAEKRKINGRSHRDISEIRQELDDDDLLSDLSSNGETKRTEGVGSVMRGVDYKKREISYENVPRSDGESNENSVAAGNSGMWFRDAEEDYRKEMAQSEVSYPAGSHVGSDRFYTTSRTDKSKKQTAPSSPRAYTLDRRHFKDQKKKSILNTSGVKILVNGKEVNDKSGSFKKNKPNRFIHRKYRINEDPSSVQSDPLYVRGGLAAAYQARQRAAVRRSNSSIAGIGPAYRQNSPVHRRRLFPVHSDMSGASSETESTRAHRPLVMYIPGISHREKSPDQDDRSSGVNVARSQSMMTSTRPAKITPKTSKSHRHKSNSKPDLYHRHEHYEYDDEITPLPSDSSKKKPPKVPLDSKKNGDIKRSNSMPKDTKFSWLKWKIRGKPSREP